MIVENKLLNLDNNTKLGSAQVFTFALELPDFAEVVSQLQEDTETAKLLDLPQNQPAMPINITEANTNLMKSLQLLAKKDRIPTSMRNIDTIKLFIKQQEVFGIEKDCSMSLDSMTDEDIEFFKLCSEKKEITINDISVKDSQVNLTTVDNANQVSYKSLNFSKGLFGLIEYAHTKQKPIRLDFQGNSSVILKINSKGGLTAEFIANDTAMEHILRSSIPNLKNKFDSEGIPYEKIIYRENQNKNKKDKGGKQ